MQTQGKRLIWARTNRGMENASEAARAMGVKEPTYLGHENDTTPITRNAKKYAIFYGVDEIWLRYGTGKPFGRQGGYAIDVAGKVGAGAKVMPVDGEGAVDRVTLPPPEELAALVVQGESQLPRYAPGETVIYRRTPRSPQDMINRMAIVDCADGRRLVKRIRKSAQRGRFSLESLNASLEEDVELSVAYEIVGSLNL